MRTGRIIDSFCAREESRKCANSPLTCVRPCAFGALIAQLRKKRGLSRAMVAERSGHRVARSTVGEVEALGEGKTGYVPTLDTIAALIVVFKLRWEDHLCIGQDVAAELLGNCFGKQRSRAKSGRAFGFCSEEPPNLIPLLRNALESGLDVLTDGDLDYLKKIQICQAKPLSPVVIREIISNRKK